VRRKYKLAVFRGSVPFYKHPDPRNRATG